MSDESVKKRSLFTLLSDLPRLLIELVKEELDHLKTEMVGKLKHAGIGIGLFAGAAFFAFFLFCVLIAAAILGLAVILPGWAAALIVAGILLVIVVILVLIGLAQVKKGVPPAPTETIKSVKQDVNAIKGIGKRANP
ncbi:phage holin family protein [Glaciihabitans sp. UYNi722]|uniref:phage holin family protein n=1 Tax=Glaciihabitans sp. UYNi722 TaxID=3156344 RepID=UPI00339091BB